MSNKWIQINPRGSTHKLGIIYIKIPDEDYFQEELEEIQKEMQENDKLFNEVFNQMVDNLIEDYLNKMNEIFPWYTYDLIDGENLESCPLEKSIKEYNSIIDDMEKERDVLQETLNRIKKRK